MAKKKRNQRKSVRNQISTSNNSETVTTTKKENAETKPDTGNYRCRFGAFSRLCGASKTTPLEVVKKVGTMRDRKWTRNNCDQNLRKLRYRETVDLSIYEDIAKILNCEKTLLYYSGDLPLSPNNPAIAFAERVHKLIQENKIPENVDVVEYIWQMGDEELDNFRITFREQREAFRLLRDTYLTLIERPIEIGKLIGKMERGIITQEDVIADVKARQVAGFHAFEELRSEGRPFFNTNRIREGLPDRILNYRDAVLADQPSMPPILFYDYDHHRPPDMSADSLDETLNYWKETKEYKNEEPYRVSKRRVQNIINADFDVRRIVFPTRQQEETFRTNFSRSVSLVYFMLRKRQDEFSDWWPEFIASNSRDLKCLAAAWYEQPPNFDVMIEAFRETTERTIKKIKDVFPKSPT